MTNYLNRKALVEAESGQLPNLGSISRGLALCATLLLAACGGGGGGDGSTPPPAATAPAITTQPVSVTVTAGAPATFSVTASGTAPLAYQWRRNGNTIAGANASGYTLAAAALADTNTSFSVVVTNSAGSATSNAALLTVNAAAAIGTVNGMAVSTANAAVDLDATATIVGLPPAGTVTTGTFKRFQIRNVPASERVVVRISAAGHLDALRVVAVRAGAVTFVRAALVPLGTTVNIDPATAVQVTVPNSAAQVAIPANALVRADNGAAPPSSLTVTATSLDPANDPERMPGDFTTLSAGTPQAIESFGALGVNIVDATGNRYTLAAGRTAILRIPLSTRSADVPPTIPLFYLDEASGRWVEQGSATLAGSGAGRYYEGSVPHFSYWNADRRAETIRITGCVQTATGVRTRNRTVKTDGVDYTGAAYAFSDANGEFSVPMRRAGQAVLTIQGGTETTAPIVVGPSAVDITLAQCLVERAALETAPVISSQPASQNVEANTLVRFAVVADGAFPLAYQWRRNGVNLTGANGAGLTYFALNADDGALFSVVVSNRVGSITSANATLTIASASGVPRINGQPQAVTVGVGQSAAFSVNAVGATPLMYQWRRNGVPIAGATASTYTFANAQLADSGAAFSVVVSNSAGSVTSTSALLTVTGGQAAADFYMRPLAQLFTGSYGNCRNAGGQPVAPIVVAGNGDASFEGGALLLSSSTAGVLAASGAINILSLTDSTLGRSVNITAFPALNSYTAKVQTTAGNATLIDCLPAPFGAGLSLTPLALQWLNGVRGTVTCPTRPAGVAQQLSFDITSGQVSFGAVSFSMTAARSAEAALAIGLSVAGADSLVSYASTFNDQSQFSIARAAVLASFNFNYRAVNGDAYACSGNRM